MGFFSNIKQAIKKTKDNLGRKLFEVFKARDLDDDFYDELEAVMIAADIGVTATDGMISELKETLYRKKITEPEKARGELKRIMLELIDYEIPPFSYPLLIFIAGVNGVGKTTAVGKLANRFKNEGKSVLVAAADTFRAAATEQLEIWAKRADVRIVKHGEGSDPAAVVFDALQSAKAKGTEVILVDTAGRLHNKKNLMEELKKINRVIAREMPECDRRNYIVLDATTGQNAVSQVEIFNEAIDIDGIILTKLDGTAKGGVVMAISAELEIPVVYAGIGEKIDDIIEFNAEDFIDEIFAE
ncbi:MAG: signal recognition particle-docking protein FtsY [Firmicutes bacterium]|nr:signal recognition particle-docking protein FtsY [Bacillota bacterium]